MPGNLYWAIFFKKSATAYWHDNILGGSSIYEQDYLQGNISQVLNLSASICKHLQLDVLGLRVGRSFWGDSPPPIAMEFTVGRRGPHQICCMILRSGQRWKYSLLSVICESYQGHMKERIQHRWWRWYCMIDSVQIKTPRKPVTRTS